MWGICLNTAFYSNLKFFSGSMGSSFYGSFVALFRIFISYLCHAKGNLLVFLGSKSTCSFLGCALMRCQGMRFISEPLSFCSGFHLLSHGSDLKCLPQSLLSDLGAALLRAWCRGAMRSTPAHQV